MVGYNLGNKPHAGVELQYPAIFNQDAYLIQCIHSTDIKYLLIVRELFSQLKTIIKWLLPRREIL